jgi:hypothetical protein
MSYTTGASGSPGQVASQQDVEQLGINGIRNPGHVDHLGASGPGAEVLAHFVTAGDVAKQARALLRKTDDDQSRL